MENSEKSSCLCGAGEYMVLACSGACDLGFKKGQTPVTDELLNTVYEKVETIY